MEQAIIEIVKKIGNGISSEDAIKMLKIICSKKNTCCENGNFDEDHRCLKQVGTEN